MIELLSKNIYYLNKKYIRYLKPSHEKFKILKITLNNNNFSEWSKNISIYINILVNSKLNNTNLLIIANNYDLSILLQVYNLFNGYKEKNTNITIQNNLQTDKEDYINKLSKLLMK